MTQFPVINDTMVGPGCADYARASGLRRGAVGVYGQPFVAHTPVRMRKSSVFLNMSTKMRTIIGRAGASPPSRTAAIIFLYIYIFIYWGERERAPSCGLNGRAVTIEDIYIYIYGRHPLLRMRGATRKRSRPDRESIQSS